MRILQIAPIFLLLGPDIKYGGTERVVYSLDREFTSLGQESHVVAPGNSSVHGILHPSPERALWNVSQETPTYEYADSFELHFERVLQYVKKVEPDVVHDQTGMLLSSQTYQEVRGLYPVLTTLHGPANDKKKQLIYDSYASKNGKEFFNAISDSQRRFFCERFVDVDSVIYHGVDVEEFPFCEDNDGYLFSLGRIEPDKGQHDAIKVAKALGKKLIIGGCVNPIHQQYFDEEIKPYLDDENIIFVGELDEQGKKPYFVGASTFLMPIHWEEPFGLVMIEAMACGTPVVAYRRGSVPEIVRDGVSGFVVDADDLDGMIKAARESYGMNRKSCRAYVGEHFSMRKQAHHYLELYDRIATSNRIYNSTDSGV